MKYKYIVWDFNGTIIDDVKVGIDSVNPLLSARGLKTIDSIDKYREKFDFPIIEYYKNLGFDFEKEPYEKIAHEWVANYKRLSCEIKPVDGVLSLIEYFDTLGLEQMILSASEREMLEEKLSQLGIIKYFKSLLALDNIYAHSKLDIAKNYFKDKDKTKYLMIGDTTHDAYVAKEIGLDVVLVCGHHGRDKLEETSYPVYDDMRELFEAIKAEKFRIQEGFSMKSDKKSAPVAVIDSGVGGISVLSELKRIMPCENYIYYGDSANAPYGIKTREEVLNIMLENTEKLLSMGAKAIVVACNTATSAAVRVMREKYPELPIVGIEPAIKPALSVCDCPTVVVMATPLTLAEEKFNSLKERFAADEEIIPLPCPGLMEIIESGQTKGELVDAYVRDVFSPLADKKIDAVVLGCTHYPFIKEAIVKHLGKEVAVLDGSNGTAREAKRRIEAAGLENDSGMPGKIEYIFTSEKADVEGLCERLLEELK